MVLQCAASVAALPEHEEIIFTASVEVSGVGLSAHALFLPLWLILVASVAVSLIGWRNPSSVGLCA